MANRHLMKGPDDKPKPVKRVRPDSGVQTEEGENRKYIQHSMRFWKLDKVNEKSPEDVEKRLEFYFSACQEDDVKPSVAGLALCLGIGRNTLWKWVNGIDSSNVAPECRNLLKKGYHFLTAQMENYMQNGKINPVAGIFLMKNNMDYKDQQEVVLTPNQTMGEQTSEADLKEKYLRDMNIVKEYPEET